ncbi:hypothetical protein NH340_JMT08283 [Sarcoptes scabiei]|nr:hypothetical protein NH340_JMT08283 [Sarcoptes scabiei]
MKRFLCIPFRREKNFFSFFKIEINSVFELNFSIQNTDYSIYRNFLYVVLMLNFRFEDNQLFFYSIKKGMEIYGKKFGISIFRSNRNLSQMIIEISATIQ